MPMAYAQVVTNAQDATWLARVQASLVAAAIAVTVDGPATSVDIRRDRLARYVLNEPAVWAARFSLAVALGFIATDNDLTAGSVTDAEIDSRVSAVFNDFLPV